MGKLWYLSPSNQKDNVGVEGYGRVTDQMYLLADAITPYLDRYGVSFHVADQSMTLAQRARESNEMKAGWYLALHSNAGGGGTAYGPIAFYAAQGKELAERLTRCLLETGQKNNRSENVRQSSSLYELIHPNAPSCLLEVDFHDSETGVRFLTERRDDAARAIARAIVELDGKLWQEDSVQPADALPSPWAREAVDQAIAQNLFVGDGKGNYNWKSYLTREQAAVLLMRFQKLLEKRQ